MKYLQMLPVLLLLAGCNSKIPNEYVLNEKDLVPEGIDYSTTNDAFYLTSVSKSKIIKVDRKSGKQTDFIKEYQFGYSPGVGLYVDDERKVLHAIGGYYSIKDSLSSLYTFDLDTQQLLKRYTITDEGEHFLNDMVLDTKGTMYLTDTKGASIYMLKQGSEVLELLYTSPEIEFPNGIAISEDNSKLYIASFSKGVRVLDLNTKNILNAADTLGNSQGIDGLEFYNGHLYGIQNGISTNSFNFRKLILNDTQDTIVDVKVIDSHTPKLDVPLTFCIVKNKAIVIGNSNLQHLDQVTFEFKQSDSISKTKLVVYQID